jgi:hypothetical protein
MADKANKSDHRENHADVDVVSIDDMTLESAPVQDRLPPMLFLAALIHGILIIGITFNAVLSDRVRVPRALSPLIMSALKMATAWTSRLPWNNSRMKC